MIKSKTLKVADVIITSERTGEILRGQVIDAGSRVQGNVNYIYNLRNMSTQPLFETEIGERGLSAPCSCPKFFEKVMSVSKFVVFDKYLKVITRPFIKEI